MPGVKPGGPTTPAVAYNTDFFAIRSTTRFSKSQCGIKIRHYLVIRHFSHDARQYLTHIGHFRHIALTSEQLRCNGVVTKFCKTAAHILDVLMHPKNLLSD